ncbi:AraC family transcriptional regulator [Seohaeicola zhoushanensis]|uniref:AraC family transcriptional regulator n=1 Tax=Seohaeicola zhoushanensis TaxID=1569283 RepID=A0A8J3M873_9RHOB|nr:AraC family transcriptional regulator [Seohaeicola zhoushanensis]GHF52425.1 AraC family transcriptional regulator [Seohaeicola zhoushanensis]
MLDLLSDILTRLSLRGTLYFRTSFTEPWGVRVPAFRNVARFHFAHRGEAMVRLAGQSAPIHLAQGDLVIIPHGAAHVLSCRHTGPDDALPLDDVLARSGFPGHGTLVWGGDEMTRDTQLICGHFALAEGSRHLLFDRLPTHIHLRGYGEEAGPWLEATLKVIGAEAGGARLGGDLIALKLSEAIFAQAIRAYIEQTRGMNGGLAGFADPNLVRALTAFHSAPAAEWTVASLAREAGLSRTGFAERFATQIGLTPMNYVTAWRMEIAREALSARGLSVAEAAEVSGYASESAFSRVFKKEIGISPAAYRQAGRSKHGMADASS